MIAQAEFALSLPPSPPASSWKEESKAIGGDNASALTEEDITDFSKAEQRIIDLMKDGSWYADIVIIHASLQREGLRRLRQLRNRGWNVECRPLSGSSTRRYEYRLTKKIQP